MVNLKLDDTESFMSSVAQYQTQNQRGEPVYPNATRNSPHIKDCILSRCRNSTGDNSENGNNPSDNSQEENDDTGNNSDTKQKLIPTIIPPPRHTSLYKEQPSLHQLNGQTIILRISIMISLHILVNRWI